MLFKDYFLNFLTSQLLQKKEPTDTVYCHCLRKYKTLERNVEIVFPEVVLQVKEKGEKEMKSLMSLCLRMV